MVWIIIILSLIVIGLTTYLLILKRSMRHLKNDFKEAKANTKGEQHVFIQSPDKDLENLAVLLNEYVADYFKEREVHQEMVQTIRNEITNFSHDLRTPLTSILGYMEYIDFETLPMDQQEAIEVIKKRATYLNGLIEDLYEYVRLENHEFVIGKEPVDIYRILREHLLGYYMEFENHEIDLELALPEVQKPVYMLGDQNCINRILQNLTSNAIKYSGGNLKVSLEQENQAVKITYRTYKGDLTDFDIEHLLDRYYKKVMKGKAVQSSGLGLTIAKGYTEQMGGMVKLYGDETYLYMSFSFEAA